MNTITGKHTTIDIKYDPDLFESPLRDYMIEAYQALADNEPGFYRMACADITNELKWSWKSGVLGRLQADTMKDYFWGLSE